MKKIFLLLAASLICLTTISAQVSQEDADQIVIDRMSNETSDFTIYAKDGVQTTFEVITASGETLELNYPCWVYYVNFADETNGKYLIVKENNGNLLEVNAKNDEGPEGVESWRVIGDVGYPIEIPFIEYSLSGTSCQWVNLNYDETVIIINNIEELENYIDCTDYPEIDFSQYTLLLASGTTDYDIFNITKNVQQLSYSEYKLYAEISLYEVETIKEWTIALMVNKLNEENIMELNVTYTIFEEVYHYPTIVPNKTWYIEHGFTCPEGLEIGCPCYLGAETITIGNFHFFNDKKYYELITDSPDQPEQYVVTYVGEDNGRVVFYVEDCDKEYLLYDYNLNVSDVVFLVDPRFPFLWFNPENPCEFTEEEELGLFFKGTVTNIDVIEYDGVPRKRLKVKHLYMDMYDYWIEGIGNIQGITWPTQIDKPGFHQLIDCYESGELIFENEDPFCWFY